MNKIALPILVSASITSRIFSSNSPLYLLPANIVPISRLYTVQPNRNFGTFPCVMFSANPSATAVLPTPGSPTISTLLLFRRARICAISSNSFSRPITVSISLFSARLFKLVQYSSRILVALFRSILG